MMSTTERLDACRRQSDQHLRALATEDIELFTEGVVTEGMRAAVDRALRYARARESAAAESRR